MMRTEEQLFRFLERYGYPTKLGESMICLNDWFLGYLLELLQREEPQLIYDAVIASHERDIMQHVDSTPVTKEKIMEILEAAGIYSEEQGVVYLNGRKVGDLDAMLQWGAFPMIQRIAFIASGKPEPQAMFYEIATDGARLPLAVGAIVRCLEEGAL